ncbi:AraC family transcriptional regulator [Gracilibacillus oryzae]|uniref:AraC family transcriptional regulator n=1 Tax=Gracilibacillus oryzae TaxID=1672701 RepID=A0A7C8KSJ0_9BACI|nr:AraC family transcriptional regulator [Gracilibacillus oryzae]KAB8136778.1 AraC family transcriptional regulator [Gracilibacillus oryzae]
MLKCKRLSERTEKMSEKRKTVFIRFLFSYFIILLLPIIIGIILFNRVESILIDNANKSNTALLEQVKQVVDNKLKEVEQLSLQVSLNPKLIELINQQNMRNYKYIEFINELKRYQTVSTNIDDYYVYFSNSDVLLSPTMKTNASLFFHHIKRYEDTSYIEIMNKMSGFHLRDYSPSEKVITNAGEDNVITFLQSLPYGERDNIKGALMVHIDEWQVRNMLHKIEGLNSGVMYIADQKDNIMMSTSDDTNSFVNIKPLLNKEAGFITKKIDGQEMIVSFTTSEENGWTYVSIVPKEIVLTQVNHVKSWAFGMLLISVVIGIIVSYYLANRNYRPIRDVVNTVIGNNQPKGPFKNELDLIKQSIAGYIHKQSQLNRLIARQEPVIRSDFILRMVRGQVDVTTMSERELHFMGVRFTQDFFSTVLIQIDDYCQFTKENIDTKWVLSRFIIANLSEELFDGDGYTIEIERDKLIIVNNHQDNSSQEERKQLRFIKELKGILEERFHIKITVAISQIHHGLHKISECYGESVMALDYRMIKGPNSIIAYNDIKNNSGCDYHYPTETEVQLLNFAKNGDYANVENTLEQILVNNMRQQEMTPEVSKFLAHDLLSTFIKLLSTLDLEEKKNFIEENKPFHVLSGCRTVQEVQENIKSLYSSFCIKIQNNHSNQGERLYQDIIHFIEDNYGDNMLSLSMIADEFGMNSSYLSTFFKKQRDLTISDFIAKVRIEESKRMLTNQKLTIAEVAKRVGYANSVGLIRVFKKVEGVTPGQYRKITS